MHTVTERKTAALLWLLVFGAVLLWSGIEPKDRLTWWLEVMPALAALALLAATRQRFPLTPLCYGLILLHCRRDIPQPAACAPDRPRLHRQPALWRSDILL
jgi:putative membrane protein